MKRFFLLIIMLVILVGCNSQPESFEQLKKAGEKAFFSGNYTKARDLLSKAAARQPSDKNVLYYLGLSYARDFLYDSAYVYLKRVDLLFPKDREINQEIYNIAMELGEWKAAKRAIETLIATGDSRDQWSERLGWLNRHLGNMVLAYAYYRRALELNPDDPGRYLDVANSAALIDSVPIAIQVIDSAIEKFGEKEELLLNKGLFLAMNNELEKSEDVLRTLYKQDTTSVSTMLNLAHTLASQDNVEKKKEAYKLYLRIQPSVGNQVDSIIEALQQELHIK